jgi:hypothetical protein
MDGADKPQGTGIPAVLQYKKGTCVSGWKGA